jgi:hypothetical protein
MTRAWLGILIMTLIFGMIGCKEGTTESLLYGTWRVASREYYQDEKNKFTDSLRHIDYRITFNDDRTFEEYFGGNPICKGIYETLDTRIENMAIRVTHIYGNNFERDSRWYSIDELEITVIKEKFSEDKYCGLPLILLPQIYTYALSPSLIMSTIVAETTPYEVATTYTRIAEIE